MATLSAPIMRAAVLQISFFIGPALRFRPLAVGEHVGGRPLVLFERHYEVRFNPKQYLRTNLSGASNREGGDGILQ